jgi:urea transporter
MPILDVVTIPVAHLLHWYFMPLYAAPFVLVLYSTIRETIRQRRKAAADEERAGRRRRSQ